jgi:hypothetical protein
MARTKSTASAKIPSTSPSNRKLSAANKTRQGSSAKKPLTRAQQAISTEQIGHVAGEVWRLLDNENGQSLTAIKKAIDVPNDLVLAAIGWLAREDKLNFSISGRMVTISVR